MKISIRLEKDDPPPFPIGHSAELEDNYDSLDGYQYLVAVSDADQLDRCNLFDGKTDVYRLLDRIPDSGMLTHVESNFNFFEEIKLKYRGMQIQKILKPLILFWKGMKHSSR